MKLFATCCSLLLLLCLAFPKTECRYLERSMEIRNTDVLSRCSPSDPDIDASWYTGRGIRPVGRFGRRVSDSRRGSGYGSRRLCIPIEENDDSAADE
ncbi:prolactin-releasing peptide isoform X1 [Lepisosteus oculatus]|uniref:prolactin-releasing peptide isoform X1 n=1 Tax=Lepisosteus oculatus TaxID=7918 RepID=UPI0007401E11|nr:PREDICTED: prolactin-releasing peptide isoform X1 [Lepisosteus oculatus]